MLVHTFLLLFVPANLIKSGSYGRYKALNIGLLTVSKRVQNFFSEMPRKEITEKITMFCGENTVMMYGISFSRSDSPFYPSLSLSLLSISLFSLLLSLSY